MHIPDGFLDLKTITATSTLSVMGVGWALRNMKNYTTPKKVPLVGLAAAFIFVAQMINFPVASGTSGHLVGATLIAVLLGPCAAIIVMTSVLIVQCLLFADGGLLTLGANIFNMAIVGTVVGYGIYRLLRPFLKGDRGRIISVAFASWCTVVVASIVCAGEIAWSGTAPWEGVFPAMASIHMLIGVGEALITGMVIVAISRTRPELLYESISDDSQKHRSGLPLYTGLAIIGVLLFVAPFASPFPDGLEKVAGLLGFEYKVPPHAIIASPWSDYHIPGIASASSATIIAGILGAVIVFGLSFLLARILVPRNPTDS